MRIGDPRQLSRRRFLERAGYLGLGLLAWTACGGDDERPQTTLDKTIVVDDEGNLVSGPGEPYVVRAELAPAQPGRESQRRALIALHHLSDFRIIDEESPLRYEWSDDCDPPQDATAFRPQEALSVQAAAALIVAANAVSVSPLTRRAVDLAFHTGNATNNAHFNELRWFMDLMDGKPVYPDSGAIGYQGVQTESPVPAFGDLLQTAQRPFTPRGLAFPWYTVIGNRDVLVEGNFVADERATRFAVGAQKLMKLGPDALSEACSTAGAPGSLTAAAIFSDPETVIRGVGSDSNRRVLAPQDWMAEHFASEPIPGPAGHGFAPENVESGKAYYVHDMGAVVFIVLDTVNRAGFADGSLDAKQFEWLEEQMAARSSEYYDEDARLVATANQDRLIVIVSHHPPEKMLNPFASAGGEKRFVGNDLEDKLHRFPNVVLHIAGHILQQRITAKPDPGETGRGSYWQVTTGGALDSPLQGRLLEIADNKDGTVSIFSTVYDSSAPLKPGDAEDPTPEDEQNQALLASVARQLAVEDPQADPQARGLQPSDRNAELIIAAPFDLATLPTPTTAAEPPE
jgi:metallophosphoesterase (TIGR03767 family)